MGDNEKIRKERKSVLECRKITIARLRSGVNYKRPLDHIIDSFCYLLKRFQVKNTEFNYGVYNFGYDRAHRRKADDVPDAEPQSSQAIRGFLVDTALPGYQAELIEGRMSLRIGLTARINLDNVRVPESAVLPHAVGLKTALACLDQARYGVSRRGPPIHTPAQSLWTSTGQFPTHPG